MSGNPGQTQRFELAVRGMKCGKCVRKVTEGLAALPGVKSAEVFLDEGMARILVEPGRLDEEALVRAVHALGFTVAAPESPAASVAASAAPESSLAAARDPFPQEAVPDRPPTDSTARLFLGISGMSCAACARTIEKGVAAIPGVSAAAVNFAAGKLTVDFDSNRLTGGRIVARVEELGYGAALPEEAGRGGRARNEELGEARRQLFWLLFAAALSAPIMPLMWWGGHWSIPLQATLATIVQFTAGLIFYSGAWKSLKNRSANMDVLVAMGISAAYGYSILAALGLFGLAGHVFFETSAMLITFIRLGKWLEVRARGKASQALRKLLQLQPDTATLLVDGREEEIPAVRVRVGDRIVIRPGEKVPVDATVEEGESAVDESMLTGESVPVPKAPGDEVAGGSLNSIGRLVVRATRVGEETALAGIVRLVETAQGDKAPIQRLADAVSNWFVPTVAAIAALTFLLWYFILGADFLFAFKLAIAVLVIACPCALGLATPTAIMVGSSVGLSAGILFKRATVLEKISRLDILLLDKTGTLTRGEFAVTDLVPAAGDEGELLRTAAAAEAASRHPLARGVVRRAQDEKMALPPVFEVRERGGHGVVALLDGERVVAGSEKLLREEKIDTSPLGDAAVSLTAAGKSLVYVARGGRLLGLLALADTLQGNAAETVAALRRLGLRTVLLSGDRRPVAEAVAREVGVDAVEAEVLPEEKQQVVRRWQEAGHVVGMVGDGINDAPALAQADIGIAVGSGTDVAKETGEIVLARGDIRDVERGIRLGRRTLGKIRQNLFWAFIYNIIGIPIAAGALYPSFGVVLKPEFAGLAMALSSVSVVANSLLLKRFRF